MSAVLPIPLTLKPRRGLLLGATGWTAVITAVLVITVGIPILNLAVPADSAFHVSDYTVSLAGKILCYAICALAMDLIWGYTGILSLGHGLFFALGGYAMGMYLMRQIGRDGQYKADMPDFMVFLNWKEYPWHWTFSDSFVFQLLMVVLVPGLLAFVFGWFAFRSRIKGVYFSIITQAMTFAAMLLFFRNETGFGGNNGFTDFKRILGIPITTREARVLRSYQHPNVIQVYDFVELDYLLGIVMELVEGPSLVQYLGKWRGRMPLGEVRELFSGVLQAIGEGHAQGIVHRDLKPDNILVNGEGDVRHPKVVDFGIAKILEGTTYTMSGAFLGTCCYMSPEQVQHPAAADHRADIYSLGVTLYQMCTGKVPFEGNHFSVMMAHVQQAPRPPRELRADIPEPLERLILDSLAKDPAQRPTTCELFRERLEEALSSIPRGPSRAQVASLPPVVMQAFACLKACTSAFACGALVSAATANARRRASDAGGRLMRVPISHSRVRMTARDVTFCSLTANDAWRQARFLLADSRRFA